MAYAVTKLGQIKGTVEITWLVVGVGRNVVVGIDIHCSFVVKMAVELSLPT